MKTNPIYTIQNSGLKWSNNKLLNIPSNVYSLTISTSTSGTASSDCTIGTENYQTKLYATPSEGCQLSGWNVTGGTITNNIFTFGNEDATIEPIFEESMYPTDYQYLLIDNVPSTGLNPNLVNYGISAEETQDGCYIKFPNSFTGREANYFGRDFLGLKNQNGFKFAIKDWFLPYATNLTGFMEWTPLTGIPDDFYGLSACTNLGRGFNCLHAAGGGFSSINSFDGLVSIENAEYMFYQLGNNISFPQTFAEHTFEKCYRFAGCFYSITASTNMAPFAIHCNSACTATSVNKTTNLASAPDISTFRALGWN